MLFHVSIAAHQPRHVAEVLAEMWGDAKVFYFPPITDDAWMVLAADERRSSIEVYPIDTVLRETDGDADCHGVRTGHADGTATHAAIATELSIDAVMAIAEREGWPAKYRKRGGLFGVIELWIEGRQMLEILTPEMQAEYRATMTHAGWEQLLQMMAPPAEPETSKAGLSQAQAALLTA